jgi:hypothetical protein
VKFSPVHRWPQSVYFPLGRGAEDLIKFCARILRRAKTCSAHCTMTFLILNPSSTPSDLWETISTWIHGCLVQMAWFEMISHVRKSLRVFIRGVKSALPPESLHVGLWPSCRVVTNKLEVAVSGIGDVEGSDRIHVTFTPHGSLWGASDGKSKMSHVTILPLSAKRAQGLPFNGPPLFNRRRYPRNCWTEHYIKGPFHPSNHPSNSCFRSLACIYHTNHTTASTYPLQYHVLITSRQI